MPPLSERKKDVDRLVRHFERAMGTIWDLHVERLRVERPSAVSLAGVRRRAEGVLSRLEDRVRAFGRTLDLHYSHTTQETRQELRDIGQLRRSVVSGRRRQQIADLHRRRLATEPGTGFESLLLDSIDAVRGRMRAIEQLARQYRLTGGIDRLRLGGDGQVVNSLTEEALGTDRRLLTRRGLRGRRTIVGALADLTFVPDGSGRLMRMDRYARLVADSRLAQAAQWARREEIIRNGHGLIRVSQNVSKKDDLCSLYVGRIFALTADAAERWGVPRVEELPGMGVPFHPNCVHREEVVIPELLSAAERLRALSPPPDWALGQSYGEIRATYRRAASGGSLAGENPNLETARRGTADRPRGEEQRRRRELLERSRRTGSG